MLSSRRPFLQPPTDSSLVSGCGRNHRLGFVSHGHELCRGHRGTRAGGDGILSTDAVRSWYRLDRGCGARSRQHRRGRYPKVAVNGILTWPGKETR